MDVSLQQCMYKRLRTQCIHHKTIKNAYNYSNISRPNLDENKTPEREEDNDGHERHPVHQVIHPEVRIIRYIIAQQGFVAHQDGRVLQMGTQ